MRPATESARRQPDVLVHPTGPADMAAVRVIAARFDLLDHWPDTPDFLDCEREQGRLAVAVRGGAVVGFSGTLPRGSLTHLGDLFIDPAHQSSGIGRRLLDRVLDGTGPRVTFASADPRAVPLYVRYGMIPRRPMYYLTGTVGESLVTMAEREDGARDTRVVDVEQVVPADEAASGGSRAGTLRWYAGLPGVRVYAGPDGYAFARVPRGLNEVLIGPAGGGTPAASCAVVLGAAARYPGHTLRLPLAGGHPLLPRLLAAGMRIEDTDTYLASDAGLVDLDRYLPSADLG